MPLVDEANSVTAMTTSTVVVTVSGSDVGCFDGSPFTVIALFVVDNTKCDQIIMNIG